MLNLDDAERVVTFHDKGKIYRHVFRRITAEDWRRYFEKLRFETERSGENNTAQRFDTRTPALELYAACAIRAEGYAVRGGGRLGELPAWRERVPGAHRVAAVDLLCDVQQSKSEAVEIDPEFDVVLLDAKWGADGEGNMIEHRGLVHRFAPPTVKQWQRFNSQATEAVMVGGSRTGRTLYRSRNAILLGLYDELICSVDGYGAAGQDLGTRAGTPSPGEYHAVLVKEMDAFHKAAAVGVLFDTTLDGVARQEEGRAEAA